MKMYICIDLRLRHNINSVVESDSISSNVFNHLILKIIKTYISYLIDAAIVDIVQKGPPHSMS